MPAFSARNARITLDSNVLLGLKWTINVKVDEIDTSNFETMGYTDYTPGLWDADVSFDAIHEGGAAIQYASFWPGNVVAAEFFLDNATARLPTTGSLITPGPAPGRKFTFSSLLLTSVSVDAEVRSFVRYSVTAKNKGRFTWPGI